MAKTTIYGRNVAANWLGFAANMVVMFFLSPFVVGSLGPAAYGVWSLLVSLTGHLGLVEIGVRVSTGRYINYYIGSEEPEKVSRVVNTSLLFYTAASVLVFAAALLLAAFFQDIFRTTPDELAFQAKWVLLLLGLNIWLSFYSSVFSQLLQANNRFDLQVAANTVVLAVRALGTVWALSSGHGLVVLAAVQVVSSLCGVVLLGTLARWKGAAFHFGRKYLNRQTFKEVFSFGIWASVSNASIRIIHYTDAIVIGLLIGTKEIAFYGVGLLLIEYGRNLPRQVGWAVFPDLNKACGRGDLTELRSLAIRLTRATMFVAVPLFVGFMVFGREFMRLWMPPEYHSSAWVLLILTIPQFGVLGASVHRAILSGLGYVKLLARITAVEAACNLILSIFFVVVMNWGIYGVALGTLIPMTIFSGVIVPIRACRKTDFTVSSFAKDTVLRWLLAGLLFASVCLAILLLLPQSGWSWFGLAVVLACLAYLPIGWFVVLSQDERSVCSSSLSSVLLKRKER